MKILGFYHVLGNDRGREIVPTQINRIKASGLMARTEQLFVGSLGEPVHVYCDKAVQFHSDDVTNYEMWTLQRLWEEAQSQDFYAYYIHTKGASWESRDERWRHTMEETVIDQHAECQTALQVAHTCGPLGDYNPEPYYRGNFWWTRADYVRTLMSPLDWAENSVARGGDRRHSAETWIIQANYHRHLFMTFYLQSFNQWSIH